MDKYLKANQKGKPKAFGISSVEEFVQLITSLDNRLVFRGQTMDWPLVPAVGRNPGRSQSLWREKEILEEFKRESIPYLDHIPRNNWQWLAIAQHNRLPTRLLDWTKNPLAALWFAVKDPPIDNQPGIVWVFYYDERKAVFNTVDLGCPFSIDKTQVYFPEHVFPFIQAQSGAFTVHHLEGQNPGGFSPLEQMNDSDLLLASIELAPDCFATIRYQLFRVGINPGSLFPGLAGLVEKIRYDNILCRDEGSVCPLTKPQI